MGRGCDRLERDGFVASWDGFVASWDETNFSAPTPTPTPTRGPQPCPFRRAANRPSTEKLPPPRTTRYRKMKQ